MKVSIEFPTNKLSELEYIDRILDEQDKDDMFTVFAAVDGIIGAEILIEARKKLSSRINVIYVDNHRALKDYNGSKVLSMTALRNSLTLAAFENNVDFGIMTDGDVLYSDTALQFIIETIYKLPNQSILKGGGVFCNLRGYFGSAGPGDRLLIPRQLPLGTNNGIIYNHNAMADLYNNPPPELPGGCEDPLFTSWMVLKNDTIPLRRFKSPIRHPKKSSEHYSKSPIHNKSIMKENNFRLIKELWNRASPSVKEWCGIPDNKAQSGKKTDEGVLSPYHPNSDEYIRSKFNNSHPFWDELKHYVNW